MKEQFLNLIISTISGLLTGSLFFFLDKKSNSMGVSLQQTNNFGINTNNKINMSYNNPTVTIHKHYHSKPANKQESSDEFGFIIFLLIIAIGAITIFAKYREIIIFKWWLVSTYAFASTLIITILSCLRGVYPELCVKSKSI
ncbi:MAG: hypothetical protein ACOY46_19630 [Bacillota bacterium]